MIGRNEIEPFDDMSIFSRRAGVKSATIRDVARRAEVSVASVSRVLSGTGFVADATRDRVMKAVAALSYVPHSGARSLSTSRTDTVGVILPDLFGEFFSELIRGMDVAARQHGLHLIVSSSHDDADEAALAMRSMRGRVDGMIVLSPHLDAANLAQDLCGSLPVLMMNAGAGQGGRPSIVVDNHAGAVEAVRHLIAGGARRIVHVAGPEANLEAEARLSGYLEATAEAGLSPIVVPGDFSQAAGHRAVLDLYRQGRAFDAVFAANDVTAVGVLTALSEVGLSCPGDVAIIGFDDVPISSLVRPALSTMSLDIAGVGRRAVDRLAALIRPSPGYDAEQGQEVVRPVLKPRASTANTFSADGPVSPVARSYPLGEPQDV